ncbi:MAG: flippase-like domain-containing protein [Actinomycetota bacterium]|nr:flippase-like domain-containing protein [Actinomycetota bacterium]MDQ6946264.1 flippase-like domain-containing protein [Actinomycetota bacterium]
MRVHRRVWSIVRVLATIVMFVVLVSRVDAKTILPDWDVDHVGWLVAALVVTLLGILLASLRWQRVMTALELRPRLSRLLSTYLAGLFVSNFLPTTIAGDALRVSRISSDNGEGPRTFASVVLERLSGWAVLPLLTLVALAINPTLLHLPGGDRSIRLAIIVSVVTLGLLLLVLAAAGHPNLGGRLASHTGWKRFTGAIHIGVDRFRRRPKVAAQVLAAGLGYQLAVVAAAFAAGHALGLAVGWTAFMAFMPVVAIVQVMPFPTIGGLGLREGALVLFLAPLGVNESHAIALGLMVYGINLTVSLLGAPAFAVGRRQAAAAVTV